ncbi:MAG: hypothetical protein FWC89_04255 [Defluviitaleaceae bacterium]|nr:hypothetical protein [Defluviitaleaceae bacterium]
MPTTITSTYKQAMEVTYTCENCNTKCVAGTTLTKHGYASHMSSMVSVSVREEMKKRAKENGATEIINAQRDLIYGIENSIVHNNYIAATCFHCKHVQPWAKVINKAISLKKLSTVLGVVLAIFMLYMTILTFDSWSTFFDFIGIYPGAVILLIILIPSVCVYHAMSRAVRGILENWYKEKAKKYIGTFDEDYKNRFINRKWRVLLLVTALICMYMAIVGSETERITRVQGIPATYDVVIHDIEFTQYAPRGEVGVYSYIDVVRINRWFDNTLIVPSQFGQSRYYRTVYFWVLSEDREVGFIQLQRDNMSRPSLHSYSEVLYAALNSGEDISPAQRIYGTTARMISIEERLEQNPLARNNTEERERIERIYEQLNNRLILQVHERTTWTERIETSPSVPPSFYVVVDNHFMESAITAILSVLFFVAFIASITKFRHF